MDGFSASIRIGTRASPLQRAPIRAAWRKGTRPASGHWRYVDNSIDLGDALLRLGAAVLAGVAIGIDREWRNKPVGIRTLALVSLGAALVCIATVHLSSLRGEPDAISRVVQGVIQGVMAGIGFLGAGALIRRADGDVDNMTTAATVWVTAAVGIACGFAAWEIVLAGVGLTLVVLILLNPLDRLVVRMRLRRKG